MLQYYAKHLAREDIEKIASKTPGWNFRQLAKFAEEVVRSYVSSLDLGVLEAEEPPLPRVEDYLKAIAKYDKRRD